MVTPWRLLPLVAGVGGVVLSASRRFSDIDLYWHVALGREVLAGTHLAAAGRDWAFTLPHSHWTTTQWLSEVGLAAAYNAAGWPAIALLRVALVVVVVGPLAVTLLRGHRTPWAAGVFLLTLWVVSPDFTERPQLASLPLLVWLASTVARFVAERPTRRPWLIPVVSCVWANLHGLWVLVPATLALVAVGRVLERRQDRESLSARPLWALAALSLAAGMITPVGPKLLLTPLTFAAATRGIQEWQPTTLHDPWTGTLAVLVAATVLAWARGRTRVPWPELVTVLGMVAFAALAFRDVPPAALVLAPLVLSRLERTWPRADRADSPREQRVITCLAAVVLVGGLAFLVTVPRDRNVPASVPVRLVTQLARYPGEHRVLNDYDAGGAVIFWGGTRTKVAVDGRADRYGGRFLDDYSDLMQLRAHWASTLADLRPDFALLRTGTPLLDELRRRQWRTIGRDGEFLLLVASRDPAGGVR